MEVYLRSGNCRS